ncbi:heparinase II/III family protein [Cellulomonas sp. zg-ZUI199]|uniref:Heparinase II/III family protein n=1 Tax=Cellulomonas wangleii TaxID=2816956 RepID=A0ABX8D9D4_9CELL|nr:heparinase II/III family protein [Cellulomonas wangleii]MBO0924926.1 heparinase II/III family protein [Cellulomonas wangleii]MBO0926812.1 heparinase II/III family protein [Cellulomonas wangleii]QVI63086.1 heparinase II/III family protein [Cellulomonas wangleii]
MREGWKHAEFPPVDLALPINWATAAMQDRSWGFYLHTWSFLDPVVRGWTTSRDDGLIGWCLDRAASWVAAHVDGHVPRAGCAPMAWYDMALSLRAPRLAWLLREALRRDPVDERLELLYRGVLAHQQALGEAKAFNARNNHGFYTAVGQLSLARELRPLPGMAALERQGRHRLAEVAATQFLDDGGHSEHSPEYHRMLVRDFRRAERSGLVADPTLRARLARSDALLTWMVQPDGHLVQFGDTSLIEVDAAELGAGLADASAPDRGASSEQLVAAAFPASGYAFARTGAPGHGGAYVALMAAFHSRAHKHADDAVVVWHDRGHEWLVDAGRYGYADLLAGDSPLRLQGFYYGTPERQYVESTRAHTTVDCDGRDHVRRGRTPYGAGDVGAQVLDGHARLEATVDHGGWAHRRVVVTRPGHWLLLVDDVEAMDGAEHVFRSWLTLPGELVVRTAPNTGTVRAVHPATGERLWIRSFADDGGIVPVTAQTEPELQGWRSRHDRELTPAWSLGRRTAPTRRHTFVVLLQLGPVPPQRVPDHPFRETGRSPGASRPGGPTP